MSGVKDIVTGKVVVQLSGRFGRVSHMQWGGQYLVVLFEESEEVVILDFSNVSL